MHHDIYFISFQGNYSFALQDALSKAFRQIRWKPVISHRQNGFLLLLASQKQEVVLDYFAMLAEILKEKGMQLTDEQMEMQKELVTKTEEKSFELAEIEDLLCDLGLKGQYIIEKIPAELEYVFSVSKENHSDIILRSTKKTLTNAFYELQQTITKEHHYATYELTHIGLHYKTEEGYIGKNERYVLRVPLGIAEIAESNELNLCDYL